MGLSVEEAGEVDAVVGEPGLLAERDHVPPLALAALQQELEEAVPHHPVPDDDEVLLRHGATDSSNPDATPDASRPLGGCIGRLGRSDEIVRIATVADRFVGFA